MPRTARTPKPGDLQVVDVLAGSTTAPPVSAPPAPARPVPDSQLNADQLRIRQLEDSLAKERGRKDVEPASEHIQAEAAAGALVVHFLQDGFTALGKVWYRGEQRLFDAQAYADTRDRNGDSWLDVIDDDQTQISRWGEVMFRRGPWPGKKLTDATEYEPLKGAVPPTRAELEAAERAEAAARLTAPRLTAV